MKLTTQEMLGRRTSCLRGCVMVVGLMLVAANVAAQEGKPGDEATKSAEAPADSAKSAPANLDAEPKIPDTIQALSPSIVTVTRVDSRTGLPAPNPNGHAGFVVDPRGYIVTPLVGDKDGTMQFKVRLAERQQFIAEVVAKDDDLNLMMLKIKSPDPLRAVLFAKMREPQQGESVFLVTSPATKGPILGRVTATSVTLQGDDKTKFIQTDIDLPLIESGGLIVSELGEPIGITSGIREGTPPVSFALTLKVALTFIKSAVTAGVTTDDAAAPSLSTSAKNDSVSETLPEVIRPLLPTIVSVTQTYLSDEEPEPKRTSQAGVVFDPRGYILTLALLDEYDDDGRQTTVCFSDQKKYVAKVIENDRHFGLSILKISVAQPIPAISLKNVPEPESRATVFAVTFQPQLKPLKGRIGSTGVNFGNGSPEYLVGAKIKVPFGEGGSLMVSDEGDPVGIWSDIGLGQAPCYAIPLKPALAFINAVMEQEAKDALKERVKSTAKPALDLSVKDVKMPDISGRWLQEVEGDAATNQPTYVIRRAQDGSADFVMQNITPKEGDQKTGDDRMGRLKWSSQQTRFDAFFSDSDEPTRVSFKLLVNGKLRMNNAVTEAEKKQLRESGVPEEQLAAIQFQTWVKATPERPSKKPAAVSNTPVIYGKWLGKDDVWEEVRMSLWGEVTEDHKYSGSYTDRFGGTGSLVLRPESPGRYEGEWTAHENYPGEKNLSGTIAIQVLADGKTIRGKWTTAPGATTKSKMPKSGDLEWVREDVEGNRGRSKAAVSEPTVIPQARAIPDTPAAKQLVEQLGAQESAAAAEAATIRQLQASGQAEQNQQPIAEHQRKLKNLLSTAFDLKLQLEELQVKELQSRLSRLERQIGQRKELREKIIARRAGELIEGDALRWDSTTPASTKLPGSAVGNTKKTATPEIVAILRERVDLLLNDMRIGNAKPDTVLRAINELAQAEPPEEHARHIERLQTLLEFTRQHVGTDTDSFSKAELLEIEAAYEKARSSDATVRPATGLTTKAPHEDERTFDGTPYSQWLKMLETERKPDKLATAMEACARLAATGDERRIAHRLFVAAKLFESSDNTKERNLVWDAGTAALKRLPGEAVVAELLAALHDEQFKDAREFQCRFLIAVAGNTNSSTPNSLKAAFKSHDQELVTTLLKMAQATEDRSPSSGNSRLLAGAASVWLISERKLGEFDGLPPLVLAAIDEVYSETTGRIDRHEQPWFSASSRLAETEPETPGLAILLAKHINRDRTQIAGRLRDMGTHAEPAVPLLIEDFLVHWKSREKELRTGAAGSEDAFDDERAKSGEFSAIESMEFVLDVLGAIGPKAKSAVPLLRQIAVLAPPNREGKTPSLNDRFFDAVKKTLALIGDAPADEPQDAPILLSEFARLQGRWNLLTLTPEADHKDIQFDFLRQVWIQDKHDHANFEFVGKVMNQMGAPSSAMHYRINETVTPRQIELIFKEHKRSQLGIYELKGNRLKIELAKPGLPRPKEFSADPDKLPEGHVLLELQRDS